MKMITRVEQSINNAINEGFTLTEEGYGNYDSREAYWRSQDKMVVSWYVGVTEDGLKKYELYTRDKKSRGQKRVGSITKVQNPEMVPMPCIEEFSELHPTYESMTVKELREIAKDKGVKNISKLTKSDLIHKIEEVA